MTGQRSLQISPELVGSVAAQIVNGLDGAIGRLRSMLRPGEFDTWRNGLEEHEPLGATALFDLTEASARCVSKFGAETMFKLALTGLQLDELAGHAATQHFLRTACASVLHARSASGLEAYLEALVIVARQAPFALSGLLNSQEGILPLLDGSNIMRWIGAGVGISAWDREGGKAYFRLETEEAKQLLSQMMSCVAWDDVAAPIQAFLRALWDVQPIIVGVSAEEAQQRTSFSGPFIRVPEHYPGKSREQATHQFRAALAHVGAHIAYGRGASPIRKLKPVQLALISLIEDARVENLAAEEFPGLGRMWASFHKATPSAAVTVDKLFARLARALADPKYEDGNPWVQKGKRLFFDQRDRWLQEDFSRSLGGSLGNDLGQMRIPFNAKTYVVEPSYRDDHSGLWERQSDDEPDNAFEAEAIVDSLAIKPPSHKEERQTQVAAVPVVFSEAEGYLVGRYSEWDYLLGDYRRSWTAVLSYEPKPAPSSVARELADNAQRIAKSIESLIKSARIGRVRPLRARRQGYALDLDSCVRITIERRAGQFPDGRYYVDRAIEGRALSVFVLVDISHSTRDRIGSTTETVIGMERKAIALLGAAISRVGDPFAIAGFCSDGRSDVRFYEVKDFNQEFDILSQRRLGGLRGMLSTRLGAALRHAGARLSRQPTERRLVLVVTDGEPSDVDVSDSRYLVEDARRAAHELNNEGVDVFAVVLGSVGRSNMARIFPLRNYAPIDSIEQLPLRLAQIYQRLAR